MQDPTPHDIQREVEALRSIKRRSVIQGPGAIPLDPDLPKSPESLSGLWDSPTRDSLLAPPASSMLAAEKDVEVPADNSGHLFWVPAHLHPELAPQEFRAFLKEHARSPPEIVNGVTRVRSSSSSGINRKKSFLSRQYKPTANDGVENEDDSAALNRRNRGGFANASPHLTVSDLQRLEELAEEAAESDDPGKLRSLLRRSLSMNVAPSVIDQMDDLHDVDEADAPIIVPRPGQILQRAARTKIRKVGLPGDGGGHRFPPSRRGRTAIPPAVTRSISSESGDTEYEEPVPSLTSENTTEESDSLSPDNRPNSFSAETFIYDSYAERRSSLDSDIATAYEYEYSTASGSTSAPSLIISSTDPTPASLESSPSPPEQLEPAHQRAAQYQLTAPFDQRTSRSPSPPSSSQHLPTSSSSPDLTYDATTVSPSMGSAAATAQHISRHQPSRTPPPRTQPPRPTRKEKEKKGGLFKWAGEKAKGGKEKAVVKAVVEKAVLQEREKEGLREGREKEKEKESSGFFGSLFGGKKKHDESSQASHHHPNGSSSSLGVSPHKLVKNNGRTPSPGPEPPMTLSYARYPIHVERAVYRLSHIKLANPRRPLYEQVLISNLMFWYLGVINKAQTQAQAPAQPQGQGPAGQSTPAQHSPSNEANAQHDETDHTEQDRGEMERAERDDAERKERESVEKEKEMKRESGRKGSLVKPGMGGNQRRAETPVKGPQYDVQSRAMEQDFGGGGFGFQHPAQSPPLPSENLYLQTQQQNERRPKSAGRKSIQSIHSSSNYSSAGHHELPPGAMPPASNDGSSNLSYSTEHSYPQSAPANKTSYHRSVSPPQPQRRSQSPPLKNGPGGGAKLQGRSLSASATPTRSPQPPATPRSPDSGGDARLRTPSPQLDERSRRNSDLDGASKEDEDLPLAMWQHQYHVQQNHQRERERERAIRR